MSQTNGAGDGIIVCLGWITHPHPDPTIAFRNWIISDQHVFWHQTLIGDLYALARRAKLNTMVHTADIVAFNSSQRQRREPMSAPIFERNYRVTSIPV